MHCNLILYLNHLQKTNDITPAIDPLLQVTLPAIIAGYQFTANIRYQSGGSAPGDLRWNFSGGSASLTDFNAWYAWNAGISSDLGNFVLLANSDVLSDVNADGGIRYLLIQGTFFIAATLAAGTFGFTWAQGTSSGTFVEVQQGSAIAVTRFI